jgi:hypothetical protein
MFSLPDIEIPLLSNVCEKNNTLQCTISNVNLCFINALRRTILSNINVCHIDADTSIIYQNTGLMHNELLKQRLLCIPVHIGYAHIHEFCNDYEVHIDVKNTTNQILYITTKDFIIKNKKTKEIVANTAQQTIFPIDMISNDYIDFAKLQSGQHIHIVCSFLISNALVNGAFNAVSLCTFSNTINYAAVDINWKKEEDTLLSNGTTVDEMEFIKKNYYILDAQREFLILMNFH